MTAFDTLARTYDADFTTSPIAQHLRARVHKRLSQHFKAGDTILELGCGTGEDALILAQRGISVIATDASEGMLETARRKTTHQPNITIAPLDLNNLGVLGDLAVKSFSGVFSNFGVINCVHDRSALARWLANRLPAGARVAFGVMARWCVWEIMWHAVHGEFNVAFRRVTGHSTFTVDQSPPINVYYPTVRQITRGFAPYFRRVHVEPLGLLLPPTAIYPVIEKRPHLLDALTRWDDRLIASPLANFADHYWIEFERRA